MVDRWMVCKGCNYSFSFGGGYGCAYREITGQRRPCDSGPGCTVRKGAPEPQQEQSNRHHRPIRWDADKAVALYKQGKSLDEIARAVGKTQDCVRTFFYRRGIKFPDRRKERTHTWDTEKAVAMRRQGTSIKEISQVVGARWRTVEKYLLNHGVTPDNDQWDGKRVEEMCRQGACVAEIARALEVSRDRVRYYLNKHGMKTRDGRKGSKVLWNTELAEELYRQGKAVTIIACRVGVPARSIYDFLYSRGLKRPEGKVGRTAQWDTSKGVEMCQQGKSINEIAQAVGASRSSVRAWLDRHGMCEAKNVPDAQASETK